MLGHLLKNIYCTLLTQIQPLWASLKNGTVDTCETRQQFTLTVLD